MAASGENTVGLHRNPSNHWHLPASNQRRPIVPLELIHVTAAATAARNAFQAERSHRLG